MTIHSLRLVRDILFRSFIIGFVFVVLMGLVTFGAWGTWIDFATKMAHLDQSTIMSILLNFFADARFFLFLVLLTPALAIHWTIKDELSTIEKLTIEAGTRVRSRPIQPGDIAPQH